jgi:pyoluteorin transport system ATP-binding protein
MTNIVAPSTPALDSYNLSKTFPGDQREVTRALDKVSAQVRRGALTALVGPDGAGKTTFLRLAAGLMRADSGVLTVLDINVAADPNEVQRKIGYMPQRFGLYEDLTVQENLDLYADLHGVSRDERAARYRSLMEMTDLGPFVQRLAGRLSGGMKQKLGLACTLIRSPELLLLDEPTVGVDPLSRRDLWQIILELVQKEGLTVLVSTSYLDEAEHCRHAIVLHEGKVLMQGHPDHVSKLATGRVFLATPAKNLAARALQTRLLGHSQIIDAVPEAGRVRLVTDGSEPHDLVKNLGSISHTHERFEDGFMCLLHGSAAKRPIVDSVAQRTVAGPSNEPVVEVQDLVRRFGSFTAVDHVNFSVDRGEIFGLLGPNGAGKTTTFRMLCGLLAATQGKLRIAGRDLGSARASARERLGYVAQKFSLYGILSVAENLDFFASAYGLRGARRRRRVAWALEQFDLTQFSSVPAGILPGGYKQRLAMAAALLHEPEILFLDEPTSGADPFARREFWQRITALAEAGVTVVVTTHFMEEAEYCDHVVILDQGRVLARGSSADIRAHAPITMNREATMEDAFIAIIEEARRNQPGRFENMRAIA